MRGRKESQEQDEWQTYLHKINPIKPKDFLPILQSQNRFLLDVRTKDEMKQGHFENSLQCPMTEFIQKIRTPEFKKQLPLERPIYVLCYGDHNRSHLVCNFLRQIGCKYVFYVEGGITALYTVLKATKNTDLFKENTFYEEDDLKRLYKIDNLDGKYKDYIDTLPDYIEQNLQDNSNNLDNMLTWQETVKETRKQRQESKTGLP